MTQRENYIRNATFNNPAWMPVSISCSLASLIEYKDELEDVVVKYPEYFGPFQKGQY